MKALFLLLCAALLLIAVPAEAERCPAVGPVTEEVHNCLQSCGFPYDCQAVCCSEPVRTEWPGSSGGSGGGTGSGEGLAPSPLQPGDLWVSLEPGDIPALHTEERPACPVQEPIPAT